MYRSKRAGRLPRHLFVESLEQRQLCVASLSIETAINGSAAGTPPGPNLQPGEAVELTYQVTNTGDVPLTNVELLDDNGTPLQADDFSPAPDLTAPVARGTLAKAFTGLNALTFLEHPTLPYLYATIASTQSLAIINTETLTVEANIPLGPNSGPQGLALSNDGTCLYVGLVLAQKIAVIDTVNEIELASIHVGAPVGDIEVGLDGRLFALTPNAILQINPATGLSAGPNINHPLINTMLVNLGVLAISDDQTTLYYGDHQRTPAYLYKVNVTDPAAPALIWKSPANSGSDGRDIEISEDGAFISYVSRTGPGSVYGIAKRRTSDMALVGEFVVGPYPEELVYSPNAAVAYTSVFSIFNDATVNRAVVWNASTFTQVGEIVMPGKPHEMFIPRNGRYLFASVDSEPGIDSLYVYETGRAGNLNIGDLNENNQLDPGEAWTYHATISARAGANIHFATAIAQTPDHTLIANHDASHYVAYPTWEAAGSVGENISGAVVGPIPPHPWTGGWNASDSRFEVVQGNLRLRQGHSLTAAVDDGVVELYTAEATPRRLGTYTVDVAANTTPWMRPGESRDVDGDGFIVPLDALIIINHLNLVADARLPTARAVTDGRLVDVNGDGYCTPIDALMIINHLTFNPPDEDLEAEGEAADAPASSQSASDLETELLVALLANQRFEAESKSRRAASLQSGN